MYKLNNSLIILDLEATAGINDMGFQTNNYIIDIGVALVDTGLNTVGTWSSLVKPEEEISDFIEKFTGISDEMVRNERLFPEVLSDLIEWIRSHEGFSSLKKCRICCWGNYFDIPLFRKVCEGYGVEYPFSGTSLDIKSIAFMWHSLSGRRTDKFNVENTAKSMNIPVAGQMHRAQADAETEAAILVRCWKDLQGFFVEEGKGGSGLHYNLVSD